MKSNGIFTRRQFVAQCGLAVPVLLLAGPSPARRDLTGVTPFSQPSLFPKLDMLTQADFAKLIGQNFNVHLDSGQKVTVELIEANTLGAPFKPAPGLAER